MGKTFRWVIPGSRLLLTHRVAMLQSGSPPGPWAYDQPVSLTRTRTKRVVRKGCGLEAGPSRMPRNILVQNAFDLSDGFRMRYQIVPCWNDLF